jgi:hypothetical protein
MLAPTRLPVAIALASLIVLSLLPASGCGATGGTSAAAPAASIGLNTPYSAAPLAQSIAASNSSPVQSSYFGMHIHHLADPGLAPAQQTPFPPFSFSTLRLWDNVGWSNLEPQRDTYNWTRMDNTIAKASAKGVSDFIFTFGYVPQWASSNPTDSNCANLGSCDPPVDLADLDNFANQLVQRYCGVVKYYETWNEPSASNFWSGTDAQLLAITQHIYSAVKDPANCGCANGQCAPGGGENPNKVLLPPINATTSPSAKQWLTDWLNYVGSPYPYADIAAFHGYGFTDNPEQIGNGVSFMQGLMQQYGLGSAELWDTEGSWGQASSLQQPEDQASWLIRFQIMQTLAGVSRFTWYAYDNCQWGTLFDRAACPATNGVPGVREPATAFATVQQWLTGAALQGCNGYTDGTWLCQFTRSNGYLAWAAWNSNGNSITLDASALPGMTQFRDWKNQKTAITGSIPVGSMPILIENQSAF